MIDGIKLFFRASKQEIESLISKFDFIGTFSRSTGNVNEQRLEAKYRNFKIKIIGLGNVTIEGSLHKSFRNGNNNDDFSFSDVKASIDALSNEIEIDSERIKIQRVEIGVNIRGSPLSFSCIEDNLIEHKLHFFKQYESGNKIFGYYCEHQRFMIKIYDKSFQSQTKNIDILRLEYKVIKMVHIKKAGISNLADLTIPQKLITLSRMMLKSFSEIQMDNCEIMDRLIKKKIIPIDDTIFYLQARNIRHWQRLKKAKKHSKRTIDIRRFNNILQYSCNDIHP